MRKRKLIGRRILLATILLIVAAVAVYNFFDAKYEEQFVRYERFNIDLPTAHRIHGIDVSRYQKRIVWDRVAAMRDADAAIGFVFIKATEGFESVDPRFRNNMEGAEENQLPRGAYHFFLPGISGKAQAVHFIETVDLKKGDLPPVLDAESIGGSSPEQLCTRMKDWLNLVEKHYKVKPIIYTNIDFYEKFLADAFEDYPLWIAHYYEKKKPRIKREWLFWQHHDNATVDGISTRVDFNSFNGDSAAFRNLLLK